MGYIGRFLIFVIILSGINSLLYAQESFVKGKIIDKNSNTPVPYTHIRLIKSEKGTTSDLNGDFKLEFESPEDSIIISSIGYSRKLLVIKDLIKRKDINIYLEPLNTNLEEISVIADRINKKQFINTISNNQYSINAQQIKNLPSISGEADIIKSLTILPGTVKGIEGSPDLFVRGGDADQNLIIFNGAPVFITGHLFGFLSVFNPDVLGDVTMHTGGFPANYGGRLSSIIAINSKKSDTSEWNYNLNVGTVSTSLKAEGPVIKKKLSFMGAVRRTYIDQLAKAFSSEVPYYFTDVNAQLDFNINKRFSAQYHFYMGEDIMNLRRNRNDTSSTNKTDFVLQNFTHTLSIKGDLNQKLFSILNIYYTEFKYKINSQFEDNSLSAVSDIKEYGIKHNLIYSFNNKIKTEFGYEIINHDISPNLLNTSGEISDFIPSSNGKSREVPEWSVYGTGEYRFNRLKVDLGLRLSNIILSKNIFYFNPEPRFSLNYLVNNKITLNLSYSRMVQYLHRVSSNAFTLPTDLWYPVTKSIKPQKSDQFTLGATWNPESLPFIVKSGVFYKYMKNLIEFEEGTNLTLSNDFESKLIQGIGYSYGWELFVQKNEGKWLGNLSYTLSWSNRNFDEINKGKTFRSRYDRRHNLILLNQYTFNERWSVSVLWEYLSGARFTPILGYYAMVNSSSTGVSLTPQYPDRNSVKLNDSHRLDLSLTYDHETKHKFDWSVKLNLYNVYNRTSPVAIDVVYDTKSEKYKYEQPGLLGFLPSLTFNATF
ncbi:TonB-dependent receptor [Mangrovivirga cuniculi]|uniref:TonB-dependent receptor plug domain-containing protein n=1 Tax=Mangrovivirga cuniculi TaxID=2715131 RepID=A0A4D7JHJ4_9BACT|nr:carboxypeptidase-like regulatory domain-containing protein [Mangrovivirga cuniculi]QCK15091.1 hypothetical protein DCC35_10190 [Mangrovivirga cuniculi]